MNVTIRQLQIFIAVAKSHSFIDASNVLHLSQPAMSLAIKNLEEALGGKLLMRSTRSVMLTPEGEAFFVTAQQLLSDWDRGLEDVSNLFQLRRGRLIIAAMPTFAGTLLPAILAEFQHRHPEINVSVDDIVAEQVLEQVQSGRIELGITFDPGDTDGITFESLFLDRFVAVFPAGHPLLSRRTLRWKDLDGHPFIALQRPSSIREQVMDTLAKQGVTLIPAFESHQLSVVGRMVSAGLGISVIPEISTIQMKEMGAVCKTIKPTIARQVGFITHQRRPLSSTTKAMVTVLKDWKKIG